MQGAPEGSDRVSGARDTSRLPATGNERLGPARGIVYGALIGLLAWILAALALWY